MQICVHRFQVCQGHVLPQYHFVEARYEVRIEETTVENSKAKAATNKLEVAQMIRIDPGSWIDLEGVVVMS